MNEKTFFSEEGDWKIDGIYFEGNEKSLIAEGSISVAKQSDVTKITLMINYHKEEKKLKEIVHQVIQTKNSHGFKLESNHSDIGNVIGHILITDDNHIVIFESQDKAYTGSEYFKKINDDFYKNRGIIYKGKEQYSSWSFELRRNK